MKCKPVSKWLSARIGWRIASPYKLNPLERDPGLVACAVESVVLHQLTQEGDDTLQIERKTSRVRSLNLF